MTWIRSGKHLPERRRDCHGVFRMDRDCTRDFGKYINYGKKVPHSTVLPGDTLYIDEVGLPLSIDPRHICMVAREPTARRLVQRINLLAQ